MKKTIITSAFICLVQLSYAQDSLRRFEFGSTLVTINTLSTKYYNNPDRPNSEFINGLFFRYTKKRLALRLSASYYENASSYADPITVVDGGSGNINNKGVRIGVGAQFSLLRHKEWFYTFADVSYCNVFSTGNQYGGFSGKNDSFSRTANGFDTFFGLGYKLKILKNMYLSTETGYLISAKMANQTNTNLISKQSSQSNYNDVNGEPAFKLHLTVKF